MNITVINGTEKHGVTYRLKEMFLADFSDNANIIFQRIAPLSALAAQTVS